MAATLLAKGKVTLHRVPRITDVSVMWSLLEALGARLRYEGDGTVTIDTSNVASHRAPYTLVRKPGLGAQRLQDLRHETGVAEVGDAADHARFIRKQRRRHDRQRGVLAAADGDLAVQGPAAFDEKTFHRNLIFVLALVLDYDDEDGDEDA